MKTANNFNLFLIIALSTSIAPVHALKKGAIAAITLSVSAASFYNFYRWLKSEEKFKPTIDNLNTLTFRQPSESCPYPSVQKSHVDSTIPHMNINKLVVSINKGKPPQQAYIPLSSPNNSSNKTLLVQKGITTTTQDPTVFIFSRGYARTNTPGTNENMLQKGGCAMAAFVPIQDNIINNAPCITFDYPDRRRCFNFGQTKDTECLKLIYEQTLKQNPHAHIILIGDCRGAKTILSFATEQPKNLKALVLFSPFFSAQQLTDQLAQNYLSWLPYSAGLLHNFFKLWFPSYDTHADETFATHITRIAQDVPLFIAHRKRDTLVSTKQVTSFITTLQETNHHHIHFLATDDTTARHSRLTPVKTVQCEVNRFFHTYGLPHNPALIAS